MDLDVKRHAAQGARKAQPGFPWLPLELMTNIMGRLPLRCLCRGRVVCKGWNRVVTSPEFAKEYVRSRGAEEEESKLALTCSTGRQPLPPVALNMESRSWEPVPPLFSRDGLMCVLVAHAKGLYVHCIQDPTCNESPTQLVVSNPVTRAEKWLPPMLEHIGLAKHVHLQIMEGDFEAYKIISIKAKPRAPENQGRVEVYDSRSGKWSVLADRAPLELGELYDSSVLFRGEIYVTSSKGVQDYACL